MLKRFSFRVRALAPLAVLVCIGCSGGAGTLVPVSGTVHSGAKMLTTGTVTFYPDSGKGNQSNKIPQGEIDEKGIYKLFTDGRPGAPAGWYKVTVVAEAGPKRDPEAEAKGEADYAAPKFLVAEQYMEPTMTPLSVEVKADAAPGAYDLKLPPPPR